MTYRLIGATTPMWFVLRTWKSSNINHLSYLFRRCWLFTFLFISVVSTILQTFSLVTQGFSLFFKKIIEVNNFITDCVSSLSSLISDSFTNAIYLIKSIPLGVSKRPLDDKVVFIFLNKYSTSSPVYPDPPSLHTHHSFRLSTFL